MARRRRRLAILSLLLVGVLVALHFSLRTSTAARLVAAQLGDLLETSATIDGLEPGLVGPTAVRHLRLYEPEQRRPYLEIEHLHVDISLLRAAGGQRLPRVLEANGGHLRLRFNREGNLLTRLPRLPNSGQVPTLRLQDLRLTLDQDGRVPLTLQRVNVTLAPDAEKNLSGEVDDPQLGRFALTGQFGQGQLQVTMRSDGTRLTAAQFRNLPFIPTGLTRHLVAEGTIPLEISLMLGAPRAPRARYRVAFRQAQARLLQPGREPFPISGAEGVIAGSDQGFLFQGTVRDPRWGKWGIVADLVSSRGVVCVRLNTEDVSFDPSKLTQIPFVPSSVWEQVLASGNTPAHVVVRLPLNREAVGYRVEVTPRETSLRVQALDLEARCATGRIVVEDGRVTLQRVRGTTAEGAISCTGDLDFRTAPSRMHFAVDVEGLRLKKLPTSWEMPRALDGKVTGSARLTVTSDSQRTETHGTGQGRIEEAQIAGIRTRESIPLRLLADGQRFRFLPRLPFAETLLTPSARRLPWYVEQVGQISARMEETISPLLRGVTRFLGGSESTYLVTEMALEDVDLITLFQQVGVKPNFEVSGRISLAVRLGLPINHLRDPRRYRAKGWLKADSLRLGTMTLTELDTRLHLDDGRLRIDPRVRVASEQIAGTIWADLPGPGESRIGGRLQARGLTTQAEAKWTLDAEALELRDLEARLAEGVLTGGGRWSFTGQMGRLEVNADQLRIGSIPLRRLRGVFVVAREQLHYEAAAETLSGRIAVEGCYPPPAFELSDEPHGLVRLERAQLASTWEMLGLGERVRPLTGSVSIRLPYRHDEGGLLPVGKGQFEIRDIRWKDKELIEQVRGDIRLDSDDVQLRDIQGMIGGGSLRLSGGYRFTEQHRGWFNVNLARVEASRLQILEEELKGLVRGPIDLSLRGNIGAEWRGSGSATLPRGRVFGIEVSDWRVPLEFTWVPGRELAEIQIRESNAQIGSGRAQLRATIRQTGRWQVEGQALLIDAALRSLAGLLGDVSTFARGRVSGRVDFRGSDLDELNDLTANVQARLSDAQVLQLPVLRLIVPHVLPGQGTLEFRSGELRGRLSGGVFRINELSLDSPLLLLVLNGSITTQGRLDLEATGHTSSPGINPVLLRLLMQQFPPIGPVPVGLLLRVTEALSDRVVHLHLSGSLRTPRVQVKPVKLLSEQAARFFLSRAVGGTGF